MSRIRPLAPLLFLATLVAFAAGCAGLNPVAVAETPAQKYAAVKLSYDAVLSAAVGVIEDTSLPANVRRSTQAAVAESGELYRTGNQVYTDYLAARGELSAGTTTPEKLEIATVNLEHWLEQMEQHVARIAALAHR